MQTGRFWLGLPSRPAATSFASLHISTGHKTLINGCLCRLTAASKSVELPSNSDSATPQPKQNPHTTFARGAAAGDDSGKPPSGRGSNTVPSNCGSGVGNRQSNLGQDAKVALGSRRWEAVRQRMTQQSGDFQHQVNSISQRPPYSLSTS